MPGRILLISVNQCVEPAPVFPLGLAYVDSALRSAGHTTRWVDFHIHRPALPEILAEFQPDYIGISLRNIDDVQIRKQETFFNGLGPLCREIRSQARCPIILGGSGFSIFPEPLLEMSGADYGIHGEGESSLLELLAALESNAVFGAIPGLVFRRKDRIVVNPLRSHAASEWPEPPTRPQEVMDFYLRTNAMLNVQTQRGCAFHCCYCTYPVLEGRTYRRRTPAAVADEFQALERAGARYVFIVDSVFNSSPEHVAGICEALAFKNLKLRWGCFLRPKGLTRDLMRLMARAGLAHIEFGTDSFCDSVLDAYGKRFTFEDVYESSELARHENVDYCHFLICGGPGETEATLEEGFANAQRLQNAVIMALAGMRVYPGTPLFEHAAREGGAWAQTDLLQPRYYLSPALSEQRVFAKLREFTRRSSNWVVGDPSPAYLKAAERLRAKGLLGPLWSYFAIMQRLVGPVAQ